MKKIEWIEDYCLNIPEIDEQHKKLFEMINKLIDNKNLSVKSKIIVDILTEMTSYSEYHFKTEENFMIKCGFPSIEEHKKEHHKFIITTGRLNAKTMDKNEYVPNETLAFLIKWVHEHIMNEDHKIKEYYHSKLSSP